MAVRFLSAMSLLIITNADFPSNILKHGAVIHTGYFSEQGILNQASLAFNVIRDGLTWQTVEKQKGIYNFTIYDQIINELLSYKIAPYLTMDYGNSLYCDNGSAPITPSAINAFVNFAVASIYRYRNKGIIFELWNEPNGSKFWKPKPNATQYGNLANAVGAAIRSNQSIANEIFVGPATSRIDMPFITTIFEMGVLRYFDAISVHPYRVGGPESVLPEYHNLTLLINQYNLNKTKYIPIISGEWGYATCSNGSVSMKCYQGGAPQNITYLQQSNYLIRQYLVNNIAKVPISIWYEFQNGGSNTSYGEDNFGTVNFKYYNESLPHIPKDAYNAAVIYHQFIGIWKYELDNFKSKCDKL